MATLRPSLCSHLSIATAIATAIAIPVATAAGFALPIPTDIGYQSGDRKHTPLVAVICDFWVEFVAHDSIGAATAP